MSGTIALKVPTAQLLANAEKRLAELQPDDTAKKVYAVKLLKWQLAVAQALDDLLVDGLGNVVEPADPKVLARFQPDRDGHVRVKVKVPKAPKRPQEQNAYYIQREITQVEADIKLLRATSQTDITVRQTSNLARYL